MKYQIRYQTLKLADLVHPPYNPRVQIERDTPEYDALKRSLEQHELVEPLVVNLCNMHCVGGNQRLTVMRDMGVEEETCVVIEQPDELKEKELCPPAVGTLEACEKRIRSYGKAVFFSSVAEVSDLMNMQEMLSTRDAHEELTTEVVGFLKEQGFDTFTLSTESCDICETCAYTQGEPCRFPERMHPCLESHGVVVSEIVEKEHMEYNLGGNTILWFSMVLYRTA